MKENPEDLIKCNLINSNMTRENKLRRTGDEGFPAHGGTQSKIISSYLDSHPKSQK